jgi:hypothetical protein
MATFTVFFGCIAFLVVIGIVLAIFSSIFGWRRRRWGYPGYYYDRPRPFFPWLFMGEWFPRRGFYERRGEFGRGEFGRGEFEHHEHMHRGPDRAGGAFSSRGPDRAGGTFGAGGGHPGAGGGFGGGGHPGGRGGFGGGGHMGGGGGHGG